MITTKKIWQRQGLALIFLSCVTLLSGCATFGFKQPEPVTVGQIIEMSKEGVPAETIVEKIRDSETVYRLTAAQLAGLHDLGIADPVLDYMQQTYLEAVRQDQSLADWDDWTLGAGGYWYGGPYYGWPLDWRVVGHSGDAREWHDGHEGERGTEGGGWHGGGGFGGHGGGAGGHGGR